MDERDLPVVGRDETASEEPVCSPKAYVSNEESAIAGAMRELHGRADAIREALAAADEAARPTLERQLEELRERRARLARRRETAYRRKMVMLGHLPPEALEE